MSEPAQPIEERLDISAIALVEDDQVPHWLRPLIRRSLGEPLPGWLERAARVRQGGSRQSAVLMLLAGTDDAEPDLLLTQRASTLRAHAGQPAFPGGAIDPGEDAVAAALREGWEETGLDPTSVTPLVLMPRLYLPASEFIVRPVLAYWHRPGPVAPVDPRETASVARVPIADLVNPVNRVRGRAGPFEGPAFDVAGMLVWGFTGMLIDTLLDLGGWSVPWHFPDTRVVEFAPR